MFSFILNLAGLRSNGVGILSQDAVSSAAMYPFGGRIRSCCSQCNEQGEKMLLGGMIALGVGRNRTLKKTGLICIIQCKHHVI